MFCDVAMGGGEDDGDDTDECINEVELFQNYVSTILIIIMWMNPIKLEKMFFFFKSCKLFNKQLIILMSFYEDICGVFVIESF